MMLDMQDAPFHVHAAKARGELLVDRRPSARMAEAVEDEGGVRPLPEREEYLAPEIGRGVAIDRDVRHVLEFDPGLGKTVPNRQLGKARPVLDAPEAFLLGGCQ